MATNNIYAEEKILKPIQLTWQKFKEQPFALIGLCFLVAFLLLALVAPLLAPYEPLYQDSNALLIPPSWHQQGDIIHFFGTDDLGRDLFSRLIYGARLTLGVALIVVVLAAMLGIAIGILSGLTRGVRSSVLNHVLDVLQSIPSLLIAIIIVAILGPGLSNAMWAIVLALLPQFIHSTRDLVRTELSKEYVLAAKLDGSSPVRIVSFSVFPNISEPLILQTTMALSIAVLDITALGFLGFGAASHTPEWGAMLSGGLELAYKAPWTVVIPGTAIVIVIASINLVGDGLRRALQNRRSK